MIMNSQIYVVDDDAAVRDSLTLLLETHGFDVQTFIDGEAFLKAGLTNLDGIVLLDIRMPGRDGIEILSEIQKQNTKLCTVMMSGHADISIAVRAMKKGAFDFAEKPFHVKSLLPILERAQAQLNAAAHKRADQRASQEKLSKLTARERQVMACIVEGKPNKTIANDLGISVRTVETHRAHLMSKLDAGSVSELVKLFLDGS